MFYFSHKFQVFDDIFKRNQPTSKIEDLYTQRLTNYGSQGQPGGVTDVHGNPLAPTEVLVNFMDNHDVSRFLYEFNDIPALHNALFYLLTMDGIPCIYYGTEQQFNGGNDPANREDMWRRPSHPGYVSWREDDAFVPYDRDNPTFSHIQKLNQIRKEYAPLRRGNFQIKWSTERTGDEQDAGIIAFERAYDGQTVLVVVNTHPSKTSTTSATDLGGGAMNVSFAPGTVLRDVFSEDNDEIAVDAAGTLAVSVPPRSGRILVVR